WCVKHRGEMERRSSSRRTPLPFRHPPYYAVACFDLMDKVERRGRPRIRTAQYWREDYKRKQRGWGAAHPPMEKRRAERPRVCRIGVPHHAGGKEANSTGETLLRVRQTPSTFHPLAQRNAFGRRGVRQQSTLFAPENQWLMDSR